MRSDMKYKLSTILLTLALIAALLCACYPVMGDEGYRTMPLGTGTDAPVIILPDTEPPESIGDTTTLPPDTTIVPNTGDTTTSPAPDQSTAPDTTEEETAPPVIVNYEFDVISDISDIGTVGGKKCTATLRYPAIKGLDDNEKQTDINKLLAQIASVEYQNRLPNAGDLIKSGTSVSYEVTETAVTYLGSNLLSVRSEGIIDYADDANDVRFVYCNLIKLSTGKDITLKKTYSDFGKIIDLFTAGKFKQISGDPALTSSMTLAGLMEQYKYHSQYGTFPETYFTPDSLVIVVETNRDQGFFAEFSIAVSAVNDCLQNKIS